MAERLELTNLRPFKVGGCAGRVEKFGVWASYMSCVPTTMSFKKAIACVTWPRAPTWPDARPSPTRRCDGIAGRGTNEFGLSQYYYTIVLNKTHAKVYLRLPTDDLVVLLVRDCVSFRDAASFCCAAWTFRTCWRMVMISDTKNFIVWEGSRRSDRMTDEGSISRVRKILFSRNWEHEDVFFECTNVLVINYGWYGGFWGILVSLRVNAGKVSYPPSFFPKFFFWISL